MMTQQKRRFLERVDFITSPGYIDGPGARQKYGYTGSGPSVILTNMAIFRFDEQSKVAYLDSVHPGVSVDDVRAEVSWDLEVSSDLKQTTPPTKREVELIRILDERRIYTGGGLKDLTFDDYIAMLENSHDRLKAIFGA